MTKADENLPALLSISALTQLLYEYGVLSRVKTMTGYQLQKKITFGWNLCA